MSAAPAAAFAAHRRHPDGARCRRCHPHLDPKRFIGHVENALLDLPVDLLRVIVARRGATGLGGAPLGRTSWAACAHVLDGRPPSAAATRCTAKVISGQRTLAVLMKASSTLAAVFADVSKKMSPCSFANCCPSSNETARRCSRSDLLPISMIVMFEFECCRASSSHVVKWLNVSRLRSNPDARQRGLVASI